MFEFTGFEFAGFEFVWPWLLLLLPVPLLVRVMGKPAESQQGVLRVPFASDFTLAGAVAGSAGKTGTWIFWLAFICWALLVLAVARPQWQGEPVSLPVAGRDLMLAVDLSGSMQEKDFALNGRRVDRLTATKAVAGEFIERRKGDRVGLILFGERAYLQVPLTFDRNTVRILLDEALINIAGKKTAIGDAIGLAVKRLRDKQGDRILILLSDGQNTAGAIDPIQAARLAAEEQLKIYTIGIGADAGSSFFGLNMGGGSDLDEATLTQIAESTGGRYYRARNTRQLAQIYAEIERLEPVENEEQTYRPIRSLYYWPLALSLILAMLIGFRQVLQGSRA